MIFEIPGPPVGKGRPRFTRSGHTYTPKTTKEYEEKVRECFLYTDGTSKLEGYVSMQLIAYYPIPKSYSKKRRLACLEGDERPDKKPDIDNIIKAVADGLNGLAYDDDKQIVVIRAEKWYHEEPRVVVRIDEA